jgi:hypothetical protein
MVAAFLDSWLTGDPEADEYIGAAAGPGWREASNVAGLAVRLYLGGVGAPRPVSDYLHRDPHMVTVSLAELLILLVAAGLVAPDAARAQKATPAPPPYPRAIAA